MTQTSGSAMWVIKMPFSGALKRVTRGRVDAAGKGNRWKVRSKIRRRDMVSNPPAGPSVEGRRTAYRKDGRCVVSCRRW